jgi:propionyl-CoA synthetase
MNYKETYQLSLTDPEEFWGKAAQDLYWYKKWDKVLDDSNAPFYSWFSGAEFNTCYNALDFHIENGRGGQTALIYDSAVTNGSKSYTYAELRDEVALLAGVLTGQGVMKGDRIIIYMPMIPQTVFAMLACARIGAIHSVVFGGFVANELATRIDDAKPKLILSASCGIEVNRVIAYKPLLDKAIELAGHKPEKSIIFQRPESPCELNEKNDLDWQEMVATATPVECIPVEATHPLYILYTSGTTGQPKGVVRDHGGHAVALKWSMNNIYDVDAGEVYWAASDVGWVVGHSYIVYGPLLKGCTTLLYEGKPVGTPDPGAFWRVIAEHDVSVMFTAPTAFRAIKKEDPDGDFINKYDLSGFRSLFLAGERCDPDTLLWAEEKLGVPVIDHWWQTETGWAIVANCMGIEPLPVKAGSPTKAVPGFNIRVLNIEGDVLPAGEMGNLVIKLPLPPCCMTTLWGNDDYFEHAYLDHYEGYYLTGDAGYIDRDGYVFIMSRIDDVINVAGHRLSTGAIEEILASHDTVAECAVIGVADSIKGQLPLGFVVLKAGVERELQDIINELILLVRNQIGPVAAFKLATVVKRLPKTRSGKILRGTMRKIADGEDYNVPATIDDPVILDEIAGALETLGFPSA